MSETKEKKQRIHSMVSVFVLLFIIACMFALWSWLSLHQTIERKTHTKPAKSISEQIALPETKSPLVAIGEHILLPEGKPVILTIDKSNAMIAGHPFFSSVEPGDIIVLYPNKAIIYDPRADKLKNVGPVYIEDIMEATRSLVEPELPVSAVPFTLEVRNGSQVAGRAGDVADTFADDEQISVISATNAANYSYATTLIVNLAGVDVTSLEEQFVGAEVVDVLPAGERETEADVVIILGN